MSDARELYQEVILDHHRRPRNFGPLPEANCSSEGYNPLCGDRITLYLVVANDMILDVSWEGSGCAICTASASVMTEALKGHTLAEARDLFARFHDVVTGPPDENPNVDGIGKLAVFSGVREYPVRIKCATLPWHTMRAALDGSENGVSTEQEQS